MMTSDIAVDKLPLPWWQPLPTSRRVHYYLNWMSVSVLVLSSDARWLLELEPRLLHDSHQSLVNSIELIDTPHRWLQKSKWPWLPELDPVFA